MKDLVRQARSLLAEQDAAWEMLRQNRAGLAAEPTRTFMLGKSAVRVQLNRGRLKSSLSRLDEKGIRDRACFLCDPNRPAIQHNLPVGGGFRLMCNPFPILPEHYTIVHETHRPQRVLDVVVDLINVASIAGSKWTLFYNGPRCGASAPDHLHFQAGKRGFMPIDDEFRDASMFVNDVNGVCLSIDRNYPRRFILLESADRQPLLKRFNDVYQVLASLQPQLEEPMLNLLALTDESTARLLIFPRTQHRPACYSAPEASRLLVSPGTVDMGGVIVLPVEEHFHRITGADVQQVFDEVCPSRQRMEPVIRALA